MKNIILRVDDDDLISHIDQIAAETGRSRNKQILKLLQLAIGIPSKRETIDDRDDDASPARGSEAIPPERTRHDAAVPAVRAPEGGTQLLHTLQSVRPELGERSGLDTASAHEGHRVNPSTRFCIDCKAYF